MASAVLPDSVRGFIEGLLRFDSDEWITVRKTYDDALARGLVDAGRAISLPASTGSAMRKAVLDALRSRVEVITSENRLDFSPSVTASNGAAGAMMCRDKLSPEQFELLTSPFVAAGMPSSTFDAEAS